MAAAAEAGKQESFMRSMLVFKMGCQQWLEDYGGDTSGYVYRSVKDPHQRLHQKLAPRRVLDHAAECFCRSASNHRQVLLKSSAFARPSFAEKE